MWDDVMSLVSNIGTVAKSAGEVLDTVKKVKETFRHAGPEAMTTSSMPGGAAMAMQPFQAQAANPFASWNPFLAPMQNLAAQQTSAWVPTETRGVSGVNLTGLWIPPTAPMEQTYVRQFGVYLNLITGIGLTMNGSPLLFSEGVFDPMHGVVHVVGRFVTGAALEMRAQLLPNWMLQGVIAQSNVFGMPTHLPLLLCKVA